MKWRSRCTRRSGACTSSRPAKIDHANVSKPLYWIEQRFLNGRIVGATRAGRWPWWRRAMYLAAAPLIPIVLVRRIWPSVRALALAWGAAARDGPRHRGWRGARRGREATSYAFGGHPRTQARMDEYELHKLRFVREATSR
jgi:hypothetical protein